MPRWLTLRPRGHASLAAQMREELETHVAMAAEHLVARGVPRDRAEHDARARFGDYDAALRRLLVSAHDREARMTRKEWFNDLKQDAALALRLFRRSPAFFAAAVVTLALGIGANGAVFSILQSALFQPLPYHDPGRLEMLWRTYPNADPAPGTNKPPGLHRGLLTSAQLVAWRTEVSPELGDVAGVLSGLFNPEAALDLVGPERAERLNGAFVTPNFFDLLGVRAARGRLFTAADESSGVPLIVLSHALWVREFGSDEAIVGKTAQLASGRGSKRAMRAYTVAGVLPPDVHFTYPVETEAWLMTSWAEVRAYSPRAIAYTAVLRLKPSVPLAAARQRSAVFRTALDFPGQRPRDRSVIDVEPMREWIVGEIRPSLELLGAVAALLLLITCATVANGLLARVAEREQELAVRTALGAGRARLVRQLLTEGALLSVAGAVAGTLLAVALQPVLRTLMPASVPRVGELTVSVPVIVFGIAMAAVTTLLAALAPAWAGTQGDASARLTRAATGASATRGTVRWRQGLVGAQAAIATGLLISATLLLTSFWRLGRVPLGFDGNGVVTAELRMLDPKYRDSTVVLALQNELVSRVRAIPGVTDVGLTSAVPFRGVDFMMVFGDQTTGPTPANGRYVDPGYFSVLRVPLVRGRFLTAEDRLGSPGVAVITESFARKFLGDGDPLGKTVSFNGAFQVVGVVADVRYVGMDKDPLPAVYLSVAQAPSTLLCIVARTDMGLAAVAPAIRRAVHEIDPTLPAMKVTTIDRIVDESVANRRFYTVATVAFASIALVLTTVGLLVVVTRVVTERRRELAIRSALGAGAGELVRGASGRVMAAVAVGVVVGCAGAYAGAIGLTQFVFQIAPRSPMVYALASALVIGVALAAAWAPVRKFQSMSLTELLKAD